MSGVVKLATLVGAMAGEGAVATTVTLSGYIIVVEGCAARKRVNKKLHHDRGQGAVILMFSKGAWMVLRECSTGMRFDHN
jgi:hypothetical protein